MTRKTIFDVAQRDELIQRIGLIEESSVAVWGKMNVCQMVSHCIKWDEMALGKKKYKRTLLGKLFGKRALKDFIKDDSPFRRNVPTVPALKIKEKTGDLELLKKKWCSLIKQYERYDSPDFKHPFFGKMTEEQISILAYKHNDHHLRQFNV